MNNPYKKVKEFFNSKQHIKKRANLLRNQLLFDLRADKMIEHALNDIAMGVSSERYCEHEVIVSLTTYGKRLYDVASTIESIMQGSMKPNRIVLCIDENLKETKLPIVLQKQQKRGLEILFCKDIRSYTKLIPVLKKYPDAAIITIDDDAIYSYDLVEKLVNEHALYPKHILANRLHRMVLGEDKMPIGYRSWQWNADPKDDSPLNFATGVGGVLYPPHCFTNEVFNEEVFMDICKYADDVWFYAMELIAGTRVRKCFTHNSKGEDYVMNDNVQDVGLSQHNANKSTLECKNDIQIKNVFEKYNLYARLKDI